MSLRDLTAKLRTSTQPSSKGVVQGVTAFGEYTRTTRPTNSTGVSPQAQALVDIYNTETEGQGVVVIAGSSYPRGSAAAQAALAAYLADMAQPTETTTVTTTTQTPTQLDQGGATVTQLIAGPPGPATRLTVGTVTLGPTGSVVISGSSPDLVIDFVLPTIQAVDTVTVQTLSVSGTGTITQTPTQSTDIANKSYVDTRSLIMAVALA